jgi:hypothetical protein
MLFIPNAKHRFIRTSDGEVHHFVTYVGDNPDTEVTEEDHSRGETNGSLENWAHNMGLNIEGASDLGTTELKKLGLKKKFLGLF